MGRVDPLFLNTYLFFFLVNLEGHEIASDVDLQNLTAGWIPTDSNKYTVTIGPYKTDRKHYGTKKVVVYGVRPSYNNLMVYRRYLIHSWYKTKFEMGNYRYLGRYY